MLDPIIDGFDKCVFTLINLETEEESTKFESSCKNLS